MRAPVAVLADPAVAAVVSGVPVALRVVRAVHQVVPRLVRAVVAVVAVVALARREPSGGTVRRAVVGVSRGSSVVKSSTRWRRRRLVACASVKVTDPRSAWPVALP